MQCQMQCPVNQGNTRDEGDKMDAFETLKSFTLADTFFPITSTLKPIDTRKLLKINI